MHKRQDKGDNRHIRVDNFTAYLAALGLQARLANLNECVPVLLGAPFIRLCATSKQIA